MKNAFGKTALILLATTCMSFVTGPTVAQGAVFETIIPLPALRDTAVTIAIPLDLGGPVRITQPVTYHAEVNAQWSTWRCYACGSLPPPRCEWDMNVGAIFIAGIYSESAYTNSEWFQSASGTGSMDLQNDLGARLENVLPDGAGAIKVDYWWFTISANIDCSYAGGGASQVAPGSLEFPNGLHVRFEYESLLPNEANTWGAIKASYR